MKVSQELIDLKQRLAKALGWRECGSNKCVDATIIKYYLDKENNPCGLVNDFCPHDPKYIVRILEEYGLRIERVVHPEHKVKPGEEKNVVWQYHVWSRHRAYGNLGDYEGRGSGYRVVGSSLTLAVLTWAVLRAEKVQRMSLDTLAGISPEELQHYAERVYVSCQN